MTTNFRSKIIICDCVQTEITPTGTKNSYINILPTIEPLFIPTHYTFTISVQLFGNFQEQEAGNIKGTLYDPNGKLIAEFGDIPFSEIKQQPGITDNITINFELHNVPLIFQGDYTIGLYIGENKIQEDIINVRKCGYNGNE